MAQPSFGDELRRLREQRGLSLKKFAQLVHYDSGYLSKIENGLKPPTRTLASACDEALDTGGKLATLVPVRFGSGSMRKTRKQTPWGDESWSSSCVSAIALNPSSAISNVTGSVVTLETARELLTVSANYRCSYRSLPAAALLHASHSHLSLVLALQPACQSPSVRHLLVRSVGESAILTAALLGTDLARYSDALRYLSLAQDAARENEDSDLIAVILACRAFLTSFSGGSPARAVDFAEAAVSASINSPVSPTTRGWVAAVSSEQLAAVGDEQQSRLRLEAARDVLRRPASDRTWAGVGAFNLAKVTAYEGGNLRRLGRYRDAIAVLDAALAAFEPTAHRHRCTALIDRAEAHFADHSVDASCADATAALSIAVHTEHVLSIQRVHRLARAVLLTNAAAAQRLWAEVLAVSPTVAGCSPHS